MLLTKLKFVQIERKKYEKGTNSEDISSFAGNSLQFFIVNPEGSKKQKSIGEQYFQEANIYRDYWRKVIRYIQVFVLVKW